MRISHGFRGRGKHREHASTHRAKRKAHHKRPKAQRYQPSGVTRAGCSFIGKRSDLVPPLAVLMLLGPLLRLLLLFSFLLFLLLVVPARQDRVTDIFSQQDRVMDIFSQQVDNDGSSGELKETQVLKGSGVE